MEARRCPSCGKPAQNLSVHFRSSPQCDPIPAEVARAPPAVEQQGSEAECQFAKMFARQVVTDYNHLRYNKFIDTSSCDAWHTRVVRWIEMIMEHAIDEVKHCDNQDATIATLKAVSSRSLKELRELQSPAARQAFNMKVIRAPYIEPTAYGDASAQGFKKRAAKLSLTALLERQLQHDAYARKHTLEKSEMFKSGELHMKRATLYSDLSDGWKARSHPDLMRKATADEGNDVRVMLQLHNDDVTMSNPIGSKRGLHKYSISSAANANLPTQKRCSFDYMMPLSVVEAKCLKAKGGLVWALCGVDEEGNEVVQDSLAAELRELETGVWIQIPCPSGGAPLWVKLKVFFILVSADWLAAMAIGFTPESTSGKYPCGECWWMSLAALNRCEDGDRKRRTTDDRCQRLALASPRTHDQMAALAEEAKLEKLNLSKTAFAKYAARTPCDSNLCTHACLPFSLPGSQRCKVRLSKAARCVRRSPPLLIFTLLSSSPRHLVTRPPRLASPQVHE